MEKQLFADVPPKGRFELLRDNADAIEEMGYMKSFSPDLMEGMKDELVSSTIALTELEQELKTIQEDYKNRMAPLKKAVALNAKYLKEKAEYIKEPCFKMVDHAAGEVGYYNGEGELILSRPAKPEEAQRTILSMNRATGTDY
jgi:hypothetical protein